MFGLEEGKDLSPLVPELPLRFRQIPPEFPDKQPDRLGGILIETDENRKQLVREVKEVIKNGTDILVIHSDVDWLKYLNDSVGRDLGDEAIKHSIFTVAGEVDKTFPEDGKLKIRLFRDTHSADETWFYLLGLSKEHLNLLEKLKEQITTKPQIPLPNKSERGISFSVGFSHSGEKRYEDLLELTKLSLEANQLDLPFDFFNQLKQDASEQAHEIKTGKILKIVGKLDEQENLGDFIEGAVKELGGLRLPSTILRNLLEGVVKRSNKDNSYG